MRYFGLMMVCLFLVGCSERKIPPTGEVTLDGSPIENGSILFVPDGPTGQPAGGSIAKGKYQLTGDQGLTQGTYKVEIRASVKSGRKVQKALGQPGEMVDEEVEGVAARFNSKTELKVEIKKGVNQYPFQVFSK